MKRFVSTVFALAIIAFSAKAQGTDALPFTRIDLNPATAALAGAGSASNATAAYSAFSNASLKSRVKTIPFSTADTTRRLI